MQLLLRAREGESEREEAQMGEESEVGALPVLVADQVLAKCHVTAMRWPRPACVRPRRRRPPLRALARGGGKGSEAGQASASGPESRRRPAGRPSLLTVDIP